MKKLLLLTALFTYVAAPNMACAKEGDLYDFLWLDPDKKVYVLQNKLYKKNHTFYGDLGFIKNINSKYQDTIGFSAAGGYYFMETWAVEVFYKKYSNDDNDTYKNVVNVNGSEPFVRRVNDAYGANIIWSPFYGKINTFNKIFYFDWSFGAGIASIQTESNRESVADAGKAGQYKDDDYVGLNLKTGLKFHATKNFHIGIELSNLSYKAEGPTKNGYHDKKKIRHWTDALITVGFSY